MRNLLYLGFGIIGIVAMNLSACGNSSDRIAMIVEERDSLRYEMRRQQRQLDNIDTLMSVLNNGLDSIAAKEGGLFIFNHNEGTLSKEAVLEKVEVLKNILENQKLKIANLENALKRQNETDGSEAHTRVSSLLAHVKSQLEIKDREIADLKEQLERKDVDIANLRLQIGQQSQKIAELDQRAVLQDEALKRQDAMLNQCYMIVASKKILEQKGIIRKDKIVAQSALDRSKFHKVDIRKFIQLTFEAKKPKILTPMPESSYSLTTDGKGNFTLDVTNPNAFWSVSNYLVIQTN